MMTFPTTRSQPLMELGLVYGLLAIGFGSGFCTAAMAAKKDSSMVLKKEPKGAVDVLALRKAAKDKAPVVVVGRIGGRVNPWVKQTAVFPIVDRSLKPCNEIPGDACKTPWDYCCEADLPKATVLVMFVDEKGKVIKKDPRELFRVKELQTVVVQGTAKRDKAGNVTVLASGIHIRDDKKAKNELRGRSPTAGDCPRRRSAAAASSSACCQPVCDSRRAAGWVRGARTVGVARHACAAARRVGGARACLAIECADRGDSVISGRGLD
jgi:hypothetical protein